MVTSTSRELSDLGDLVAAGVAGHPVDAHALIGELDDDGVRALETLARAELARLPTPLFEHVDSSLTRERAALRRVVAHAADRLGRPDELIDVFRSDWLRGQSVVPLLEILRTQGLVDEANLTARLALFTAEGSEEERIEEFLTAGGRPPDGWIEAVRAFARAPSRDGWRELLQFTPDDVYYYRVRSTLRLLRRLGVDPDVVFQLATTDAVTPDAIELAESGLVSVPTILERMNEGPEDSRPLWLGLAARAAFEQGDRFGAARFLGEAYRIGREDYLPTIQAMDIRDEADDELQHMLDRAGVPRFD
ncbi:MAG: hypothetical protein EP329_14600 [Deltaproteobacteria bacterium]|nr:MAG: hypothetical protein EP329_14600 [Deltaproteobacteria bacterium]